MPIVTIGLALMFLGGIIGKYIASSRGRSGLIGFYTGFLGPFSVLGLFFLIPKPPKSSPTELIIPDGWLAKKISWDGYDKEALVKLDVETSSTCNQCPICGAKCPTVEQKEEKFNNIKLNGKIYNIVCKVPIVKCNEHGIQAVKTPFAE